MKNNYPGKHIIALILLSFLFMSHYLTASKPRIDPVKDYFELNNGLQIVIKSDHKMKTVSVSLAVRFGSAYDIKGKEGLAHFTFMVADRAITNAFAKTYNHVFETDGTSYSPSFSPDLAIFSTVCAPNDLETVLSLEAQRLSIKSFDPQEFDAVKRLKVSEFVKGSYRKPEYMDKYVLRNPIRFFWEYEHNPAGVQRDVQIARMQDIERFLDWYYTPSNASLVIRGPVNVAALKQHITDIYNAVESSDTSPLTYKSFSKGVRQRWVTYPNISMKSPGIAFSYRVPPMTKKEYQSIRIMYNLIFKGKNSLFGSFSSRANSILEYYTTLTEHDGPNIIAAKFSLPDSAYWDPIKDHVYEEFKKLFAGKITTRDFNVAKRSAIKDLENSYSRLNYTETVARMLLYFNSPRIINKYNDLLYKISREELIATIKDYLFETNETVIYYEK